MAARIINDIDIRVPVFVHHVLQDISIELVHIIFQDHGNVVPHAGHFHDRAGNIIAVIYTAAVNPQRGAGTLGRVCVPQQDGAVIPQDCVPVIHQHILGADGAFIHRDGLASGPRLCPDLSSVHVIQRILFPVIAHRHLVTRHIFQFYKGCFLQGLRIQADHIPVFLTAAFEHQQGTVRSGRHGQIILRVRQFLFLAVRQVIHHVAGSPARNKQIIAAGDHIVDIRSATVSRQVLHIQVRQVAVLQDDLPVFQLHVFDGRADHLILHRARIPCIDQAVQFTVPCEPVVRVGHGRLKGKVFPFIRIPVLIRKKISFFREGIPFFRSRLFRNQGCPGRIRRFRAFFRLHAGHRAIRIPGDEFHITI